MENLSLLPGDIPKVAKVTVATTTAQDDTGADIDGLALVFFTLK